MAKLVNPKRLISLEQAAQASGYSREYLRQLAIEGRLEAWLIGSYWATLPECVEAYKKSSKPVGRPARKSKQKS